MKLYRVVPLLLLLFFLPVGKAGATLAPIDPSIILGGGAGSIYVNGLTFSGSSPTDSSGNTIGQFFFNNSGVNFFSLTITITSPFTGPLSCGFSGVQLFVNCVVNPNGTSVTFFGTSSAFQGILSGKEFSLSFGSFPPNSTVSFDGVANVPEPGTLTLLGMGLGALAARRKWLKRFSLRA